MRSLKAGALRLVLPALAALTVATAVSGNGGDGHQFPHIDEEDAVLYGLWFVEQLVAQGEIDPSWRSDQIAVAAELRELVTGPEWVVTASNAHAMRYQRLNIYFGPMGQYLGWEPASEGPGAQPAETGRPSPSIPAPGS